MYIYIQRNNMQLKLLKLCDKHLSNTSEKKSWKTIRLQRVFNKERTTFSLKRVLIE